MRCCKPFLGTLHARGPSSLFFCSAHTLKEVTYTTFLKDGQILETMGDGTVTVHIKGNDIYFNNAKIVNANVLTNNGLIHM